MITDPNAIKLKKKAIQLSWFRLNEGVAKDENGCKHWFSNLLENDNNDFSNITKFTVN